MQNLVSELQELPAQERVIVKFYCMQPISQRRASAAWKLQMNLREDRATVSPADSSAGHGERGMHKRVWGTVAKYEVMRRLVNSTLWFLAGTTMKQHVPVQSSLALQISRCLGKGKGRGKGKSKNSTKK